MSKEFSVKLIAWAEPDELGRVYSKTAFDKKELPTGFVVKDDGLYYDGVYEPGQSQCVLPKVNAALSKLLGVGS